MAKTFRAGRPPPLWTAGGAPPKPVHVETASSNAWPGPVARGSVVAALIAVAAWLWVSWCGFPNELWNDVRLAPAAALFRGLPVYPTATSGTINTWAYGPLPLVLLGPATWAPGAGPALQLAGVIVLATATLPVLAVCWFWPATAGLNLSRGERLLATAIVLGAWPRLGLQNIQADSFAVAFGLIGLLALLRHPTNTGRWIAAGSAVAALACKQTAVGIAAAQLLWLGLTASPREALRHAGRCVLAGILILGWVVAAFGWEGPWFTMVTLPSHYPWDPEPAKRLVHFSQALFVQLAIPAAVLWTARRAVWRRDSPLLLPSLAWVCALPTGLAAFLKQGGSMNSIEGWGLWLPFAVPAALAWARTWSPALLIAPLAAGTAVLFIGLQLAAMPNPAWQPSLERQRQADFLARNFPGAVWFPWNPLVTLLPEGRYYHDEDGFYVRLACGLALVPSELRSGLPPAMHVVALPHGGVGWSIAPKLFPAGATRTEFGAWEVYSWEPNPTK
jgi:hypothetical protein